MASLRPAKCYRKPERPNTRVSIRKPKRSYIKGIPDPKIHRYEVGNRSRKFKYHMDLKIKNHVQVRHNALEASRVAANKVVSKAFGPENYLLKVLVYPHHVMRENPLATGAGADRFQTGMRKSFGRMIGRAAIVKKDQSIIRVFFDDKTKISEVKRALKLSGAKLPSPFRVTEI